MIEIVPVVTEQVGLVITTVGALGTVLKLIALGAAITVHPFASATLTS